MRGVRRFIKQLDTILSLAPPLTLAEGTVLRLKCSYHATDVQVPLCVVARQRPLPLLRVQRVEVEVVHVDALQVQQPAQLETVLLQPLLLTRPPTPSSRVEALTLLPLLLLPLGGHPTHLALSHSQKLLLLALVDVVHGGADVGKEEGEVFLQEGQFGGEAAVADDRQLADAVGGAYVSVVEEEYVDEVEKVAGLARLVVGVEVLIDAVGDHTFTGAEWGHAYMTSALPSCRHRYNCLRHRYSAPTLAFYDALMVRKFLTSTRLRY